MDLAVTGKKAILIPTPGQTEQEYLAKTLAQQGAYVSAQQSGFRLEEALKRSGECKGLEWVKATDYELYRAVVEQWVEWV
jgi:hypothetical protein